MREDIPAVEFNGVSCWVHFERYENRRLCMRLIADDESYARATVNVPDAKLAVGEILVKNWSENRGMLDALLRAGIVEDTGRTVATGYAEANVVRLLVGPNTT